MKFLACTFDTTNSYRSKNKNLATYVVGLAAGMEVNDFMELALKINTKPKYQTLVNWWCSKFYIAR